MDPDSQVIFLPGTVRSSRQTHSDIAHSHPDDQIQFSSNEDEIRSREELVGSDIIDPVYSNSYQAEDHHDPPVMAGSYAYVRHSDCCFNSFQNV